MSDTLTLTQEELPLWELAWITVAPDSDATDWADTFIRDRRERLPDAEPAPAAKLAALEKVREAAIGVSSVSWASEREPMKIPNTPLKEALDKLRDALRASDAALTRAEQEKQEGAQGWYFERERERPTDGRCDRCGDPGPGHPAYDGTDWNEGWRIASTHMEHRCEGVDAQAGYVGRAMFFEGRHPMVEREESTFLDEVAAAYPEVMAHAQRLVELEARLEEAVDTLRTLATAVHLTNKRSEGVYTVAAQHGCYYNGPTHEQELNAADAFLARHDAAKEGE